MNKLPVLALFSLLFVASVSSFPLQGLSLDSFDLPAQEEGLSAEDMDNDYGIDGLDSDQIEDYVLGQPEPQRVTTGACYQKCKTGTSAKCINTTPKDIKKFTMGDRNYCVVACSIVNTNCFKT